MSQVAYFAECARETCGAEYNGPTPPPANCPECGGPMWSTGGIFRPDAQLPLVGEGRVINRIDLEAAARLLRVRTVPPWQDPRMRLRIGIGVWLLLGTLVYGFGMWRGWW